MMSPRKRALSAYRAFDVPPHVVSIVIAVWLIVGTAVALHFNSFDLPENYPVFIGWAVGGFAGTVVYILFVCD